MNIQEVREKYPQYSDLDDQQLATALHKKYYSDMPFDDFADRVGLQTKEAPQRSFIENVTRSAKMLGIEAAKGAVSLAMMPVDAANEAVGLVKNVVKGDAFKDGYWSAENILRPRRDNPSRVITDPLTSIQPQPENTVERFSKTIAGSLGGAGAGIKAGQKATGTLLDFLAKDPGRQLAGATTGSASAQYVADAGGGAAAQTIAGLAGGAVGSAGAGRFAIAEGAKRSFRGGEQGRETVARNIESFGKAGTTPSVGQATENRRMRATESLLSRAPGGAGVMAKTSEQQAKQMGSGIERLADTLSPRASAEQTGRAIKRGVSSEGGFVDQFKAQSKTNYDQLDKFVKKDQKFLLTETVKTLDELTALIPNAERTSKFFINSKIKSIKEALDEDLFGEKQFSDGLPYEAVKKLRTIVGEHLADATFNGDVPRSQWKRLYAAMTSDLEYNAKKSGPQAEAALSRANRYHSAGMKRLDTIASVIDKNGGPEAIFRAATSGTKEGATTLRAVMQSIPSDAQKMLSATMLRRLGRAKPAFSTETFLSNWNSLSKEAKATLFGRYGEGFSADMDQVAKTASNLREGQQVFRNPSGTSQAGIQYTTAGAFFMSVISGNVGAASAIAGGVAASNLSARLLTYPPFVKWLAKTTRYPSLSVPVLLNQLAQSSDPIMKEAAELLKQRHNEQKQ